MDELTQLEQQISALLVLDEYGDDFPDQLQSLVSARHEKVQMILGDSEHLSRKVFDEVQQRTRTLKKELEQNRFRIKSKLLTAKNGKKSVAVYQMYQK